LAYPDAVAGLVLLAPVTHRWPGGVGWFNPIVAAPVIGPLFAYTVALPLGEFLIKPALRTVFAPQEPPADYVARAGAEMILRPAELTANAEDLVDLKAFVTAQAPHYAEIQAPTVIIAGDADKTVSPQIHSEALVKVLPHGRLILLPGVGHMVQFAAPDTVVAAIDEVASGRP
jgi:pimeloyl-ACP methyl ester carboxylesterase